MGELARLMLALDGESGRRKDPKSAISAKRRSQKKNQKKKPENESLSVQAAQSGLSREMQTYEEVRHCSCGG
jgi:hypothetical protein